jgi:hypothetical protein
MVGWVKNCEHVFERKTNDIVMEVYGVYLET